MYQVPLFTIIYLIFSFVINPITSQHHLRSIDRSGDKLNYLYNFLNKNGHKQMCSLLRNANLDNYLNSFEYTLISPTDDAFSLIPVSIKQQLLNDTEFRLNFVKSHIINGRLFFKSLQNGQEIIVNTVSNNRIHITAYPNGYVINGAQLLASDIPIDKTPNLAQFVDKPIYLQPTLNLIDYLNQNYKQFVRFVEISGLQDELQNDKERTLFVPNDEAFRSLSWPVIEQMYNNNTFLKSVLRSHILNGIHYSLGLQNRQLTSILRTQNGDKLNFKTKKLQSRNLVFVNDIPIINADQLAKNSVVHEISKLNLPKQLINDCNCVDEDEFIRNQSTATTIERVNANLLNKNILIENSNNNLFRSTIIPESMKRKYLNLHNRQYSRPNEHAYTSKANQSSKSDSLFKPMVFYDRTDSSYYTTSSPLLKSPVAYHSDHNYHTTNQDNINNSPQYLNHNSLNSMTTYLPLPSIANATLESPFLTVFDPFSPYANQTPFSNARTQFHSSMNINQSLPSMTHYLTHIYHENDRNLQLPSSNAFVYNMERFGLPLETTTFKPFLNTGGIINYQVLPPMLPTTTAHNANDYPIRQSSTKTKVKTSSKYYNDLTTPTPMYFDPTRKPKSPSYLNRMRRVNDLLSQNNINQQYLQASYQVLDSNVVQKVEDTKTASNNNNQQIVIPARLDLNKFYKAAKSGSNQRPLVTVSTVSSGNNQSLRGNNFSRTSSQPFITLLDVIKNPFLMINNERIEFSLFESLLNQTNLANVLKNKGQLTLILPTNFAFGKLKDYELDYLKASDSLSSSFYSSAMRRRRRRQLYLPRQDEMRMQTIKNLVLNHISPILVNPESIVNQVNVKSYSNFNLQFTRKSNKLYLNGMPILATTIVSNGVAYVVDSLIMNRSVFDVTQTQNLNIKKIDTIFNPSIIDTSKLNSSSNLVDQIESIPDLSFFTSLVKKSNYSSLQKGVYTILAPENKAFSYLSHQMIDLLKNSPSYINRFVGNHIINANFSLDNLVLTPIVLNLNKLPIKVDNGNGMIVLNDTSMIKKPNLSTSNGFIHILTHTLSIEPYSSSNIMLLNRKPIFEEPTIQDQLLEISKSRNAAKFLTLFIQNNYLSMLKSTRKNFTFIIPSDVAYYSLPENVINKMENSTTKLKTLLNYHLLNQLVNPYSLQPIDQLFSSTGLPLHYTNVSSLNERKLNIFNMKELNGLNDSDVRYAGEDQLISIRKAIEQLKRSPKNNQLTISGASIKEIKLIELDNQYSDRGEKSYVELLFVDRVLYTPKGTIYDLIKSSPMLTILNELIEITNLKDEINWSLVNKVIKFNNQTIVGYTFFAPSNTAFERLGLDLVEQLKRNTETARVFLLRHLVRKPLFTSSIPANGSLIENSTGEHLNLQRSGDIVAIEGVIVEVADITTTNGVVHVIENVL